VNTPTTVWLIQWEDEDMTVFGIAASPEAAAQHVKETYAAPYVVRWGDLKQDGDGWALKGRFSEVPGKSTAHSATFVFTEFVVLGEAQ
jgi:hypothetical protein